METTSRYEALLGLHKQKTEYIKERDTQAEQIKSKERHIRELERELEDKKEELDEFKTRLEDRKEHLNALITAVDEGIKQFTSLSQQTKK